MLVLGIETSCDETSASVVDDMKILSNIVLSQIDIHKEFGGVVPEIACRHHVESIMPVIESALKEAGCGMSDIEGIAVTCGPGLVGALMVGVCSAKAIAFSRNISLIGVNHVEAHIFANLFDNSEIKFPFISLIVSGGHTMLVLVKEIGSYEILGTTLDDASGEAFDKVAKLLGLGYPGGPVIDKLAKQGDKNLYKFPRPCMNDKEIKFSFSGLKTAVLYFLNKYKKENKVTDELVRNVSASFQEAVCEVLVKKTLQAAAMCNVNCVTVGGGVALNSRLQELMREECEKNDIKSFFPKPSLCGDNAAMIAGLGYEKIKHGIYSDFSLDADSSLYLESWK